MSTLEQILRAQVYDVADETPLEPAANLSRRLGHRVLLKREDLQPVFSFKLRGAYNKIAGLSQEQLSLGVLCASAGNHAQGVALAAQRLKAQATIFMPVTTPSIKVKAVKELGATVVLAGENYDEAFAAAQDHQTQSRAIFVHPFDDPEVIAGQGTIGVEILRQAPGGVDTIYVPVGGGGLIAGIAAYTKAVFPEVRIVGVEPETAPSMTKALEAGKPVTLETVGGFADGVAVRRVGDETFRLCQQHVDDMVLVNTDQICASIRDIFEDTRSIVEPAGALAVAGLKKDLALGAKPSANRALVAINCGANINFDRLRNIAERASLGDQQEALFAVRIPERPGSFQKFCEAIGDRHVTEFNYRFGDPDKASIFTGLELGGGAAERKSLISRLESINFEVVDLTDDELSKVHLRYMVGGRARSLDNERLFLFRFPERRGALGEFLQTVGDRWNISLFHYRNHGMDYGRVLVGIQVPPADHKTLLAHLDRLGYEYREETDHRAFELFLR